MEKYNILYVDDEPSNLRVFKDTYRRKYNVFTAISAKEGMKLMEEERIDLILSDQRMPEMSGIELLKYSLEKYPKTNRILITGYSDINAVENAINEARVFQYIQKPWNEKSLSDVIDDALRIYRLERENAQQKIDLQLAKEKAEENDMLKTEFLHNLSHEIRTPLNGIYGFSQMLDSNHVSDEDRKNYINIIKNSSTQLVKLVGNILDFSKLLSNQVRIENDEISLNDLFKELYAVFELKAKKKHIEFILELGLDDQKSIVVIDRAKLYQILGNILDNAFKFTEIGFIKFGYNVLGDTIKIHVIDSGIGIHPDNQQFIFERFSQEERYLANRKGGLGLGLSISQEIAKVIGATITLRSEKDKGSEFYVEVPYEPVISQDAIFKTSNSALSEKINDRKNFNILIAEDDEVNMYLLDIMIKKIMPLDVKIFHAFNGRQAIEICEQNKDIDFIFMDIKMPIMDGHEATRKIKEFMPTVPVVAQTAYIEDEDLQQARNSGCDEIINKPINRFKLEEVLSNHFNNNEN